MNREEAQGLSAEIATLRTEIVELRAKINNLPGSQVGAVQENNPDACNGHKAPEVSHLQASTASHGQPYNLAAHMTVSDGLAF